MSPTTRHVGTTSDDDQSAHDRDESATTERRDEGHSTSWVIGTQRFDFQSWVLQRALTAAVICSWKTEARPQRDADVVIQSITS